ncbi:SURP and G-patch domain-containing protein 1 [Trichoplax sp. H2]|nr:SURP and G-patch domain-containing protein 1 [Trichoplax sp. H2]|eukprot:RDD43759.1 SURP and G-patch domain-containing protein 1 [Trichoplax sp. H2]
MDGIFKNDGSFLERFQQLQQLQSQSTAKETSDDTISRKEEKTTTKQAEIGSSLSNQVSKVNSTVASSKSEDKVDQSLSSGKKSSFKMKIPSLKKASTTKNVQDTRFSSTSVLESEEDKEYIIQNVYQKVSLPENPDAFESRDQFVQLVATRGDEVEELARIKYKHDRKFKFLMDKKAMEYQAFRMQVEEVRRQESEVTVPTVPDSSTSTFSSGVKRRAEESVDAAKALAKAQEISRSLAQAGSRSDISQSTSSQPTASAEQISNEFIRNQLEKAKQEAIIRAQLLTANKKKKSKYEYDSDEEVDGGTWEHKMRMKEMERTRNKAENLTQEAKGKHHLGDFLPKDELEKFLQQIEAIKQGKTPHFSDYMKNKLKENNIGYQMLLAAGWKEGTGLGSSGQGIVEPVNKGPTSFDSSGVGVEKPQEVKKSDDEFELYRKRMMLAYRFRPNPLNNPRRPYY